MILGIDPGLNVTGYGIVSFHRTARLVEAGTIMAGKVSIGLGARLRNLHEGALALFDEFQPDAVAVEKVYSHYAHPQTAVMMAQARGVLCLAAGLRSVDIHDYPATQVKLSLTGNGRAPKLQVQRAVQEALALSVLPQPEDVADALAVALCHCYHNRS